MSENIINSTDADFEADVLKADKPVLVDFWAEWCNPCKALLPVIEEVAKEYTDKIKVVKVDIDANSEMPAKYGVRGIPTLILFKDGEVEATKVGSLTKSQLTEFIDGHI